MDNEEKDFDVVEETPEVEETTTDEIESQPEETIVITKEKFKAMQEKAIKFDESLKKPKVIPVATNKATNGELSTTDILYVAKADIHEDDMEDVLKHAKLHNVSVKEAHNFLKPILDVRKEQRNTSQATHTRGSARGSSKISDETLLENAKRGKLPDNDADMLRLAGLKG